MNLLEFLGSQIGEDTLNFVDEIKKILDVTHVTANYLVELASYTINDVFYLSYSKWKDNGGTNASPIT